MKYIKSIIKYIILLFMNLLKLLKDMFLSETKNKEIYKKTTSKKNNIEEVIKVTPHATTPPDDNSKKSITDQTNYQIIASEYINFVFEKEYEINKYDELKKIQKEIKKANEILTPTLATLLSDNPKKDYYNQTIDLIEKLIKESDKFTELKSIIFPIKTEEINIVTEKKPTIEEIIEKELNLEFDLDQEFIEQEEPEIINEFTKVITAISINNDHIHLKNNLDTYEEIEIIKNNTKENKTIKEESKEETKEEKKKDKKEDTKEEIKNDHLFDKIIFDIHNSISEFNYLIDLEKEKNGIEYKKYEELDKELQKRIKKHQYQLLAYSNYLSETQKIKCHQSLEKLENLQEKLSNNKDKDTQKEEALLNSSISEAETISIEEELKKVTTNTIKYNLSNLEELNELSEKDMIIMEKKLLIDKFRDLLNTKPSILFRLPFMKKNHFLNYSSSLLFNANLKQLHNIINHQTNNTYNHELKKIKTNKIAFEKNEALIEDNIYELDYFKEVIKTKKPYLAKDPEIILYMNMLKSNLNSKKVKLNKKQKAIKKYCYQKARVRKLIK